MEGADDERSKLNNCDDRQLQECLRAPTVPDPESAFYEWTGEKTQNLKWQFTLVGADWFCFASIWDRAETADGTIESFALATLLPDPAFERYHDRAPLVLGHTDYTTWLYSPEKLPERAKALFPAPKKLPLHVELATV